MATGELFTVFGANGWLGGALVAALTAVGHRVQAVTRHQPPPATGTLGHVLWAIGMTANFHGRPLATTEAHVCLPAATLAEGRWESFLYLSSTRLYAEATDTAETVPIAASPTRPSDLFTLSKLAGEALCLGVDHPAVRVVRLSNVFGPRTDRGTFLASIVDDAVRTGHVTLHTTRDSAKDYVALSAVCALLPRIALGGRQRLYNVARGENTANGPLVDRLATLAGCTVAEAPEARSYVFPPIAVDRLTAEFGPVTATPSVLEALPELVTQARAAAASPAPAKG